MSMNNIIKIIERFNEIVENCPEIAIDRMGLAIDIEKTAAIQPLDFEAWLAAPESDFIHDLLGIYKNFNRETGAMDNCFLPRFAIEGL